MQIAPSADGSVIYAVGQSAPRLVTYSSSGRVFEPYLDGISAFSVSFAPDRRAVAYIRVDDHTLWRADANGQHPQQLSFAPLSVDAFAWSPDSLRLAIRAQEPEHHTKIFLMPANGGAPEPLDAGDVEQGSPTWSADGTRIAFGDVPAVYGEATGSECIHTYSLATHTTTDIPGSIGLWSSRWSPDGRYIAATRIRDRSLMLYDVRARAWRDLGLEHVGELTWSPDSTAVFAEPERPARWLVRVHIPDGRLEPQIDLTDQALHFGAGVTLDGRPLLLRSATDIFAVHMQRP
jgi:Tol biopolymer transport system component